MSKILYFWDVRCDNSCRNVGGATRLTFMTESNVKPDISCGPCGSKPMTNISLLRTETITE